MTPSLEDQLIVAKAVTGVKWKLNGNIIVLPPSGIGGMEYEYWSPKDNPEQRLALHTFIAGRLPDVHTDVHISEDIATVNMKALQLLIKFKAAISIKSVETLVRIARGLIENE